MSFEKMKQIVASHDEEDEGEDLNEEEETSDEDGHSSENTDSEDDTSQTEESEQDNVEYWKQKAVKAEQERENYKQGMLSAKAKKRSLTDDEKKEEQEDDISDERVLKVIYKQNERSALREVINPKSENYIPELVDDAQYDEIIAYLPQRVDKSSTNTIVRALKSALVAWKHDTGRADEELTKKGKKAGMAAAKTAELASIGSSVSGGTTNPSKPKGRRIIKSSVSPTEWYK